MPAPNSTLKARLLVQAEQAIDELLAQKPAPETTTLAEIEQVVLKAEQAIAQALTAELLAESGAAPSTRWPTCPRCGRRLKAKGKRKRRVATVTGEAEVQRDYYHCRPCRQGIFPPG
jgi:hypothetical protein